MDDVCICTMEPRPRVLGGPNGNLYGDEVLVPVEGSVTLWDHQTPVGITGGVQTEAVFVHLEYLAPERGGKGAMRVRSIPATPGRFPTFHGASESQ